LIFNRRCDPSSSKEFLLSLTRNKTEEQRSVTNTFFGSDFSVKGTPLGLAPDNEDDDEGP
jgi:hypothetical protein